MQTSDYDVEILNDLIATLIVSVDGLRSAAHAVSGRAEQLRLFTRARLRDEAAAELETRVLALGREPAESAAAGGIQQSLLRPLETADTLDGRALIAEATRGDDHLIAKFACALSDAEVASATHDAIARARDLLDEGAGAPALKLAA